MAGSTSRRPRCERPACSAVDDARAPWRPGCAGTPATAPRRPAAGCRGAAGSAGARSDGPGLDDLPAVHDHQLSARSAARPRSWVISSTAVPSSAVIVSRWSRICRCTVTSSADVGSSAMSSRGWRPARWRSARAGACRRRTRAGTAWPGGRRRGRPASASSSTHARRRPCPWRRPLAFSASRDLVADLPDRVEVGHRVLRHHADGVAAQVDHRAARRRCVMSVAVEQDLAAGDPAVAGQQADDGRARSSTCRSRTRRRSPRSARGRW